MPDINVIKERLEASRKNLLDISMRNRLINYRTPKTRGVEVFEEDPVEVFRILVKEEKAMTFTGKPDKKEEQKEVTDLTESSNNKSVDIVDTKDKYLNTKETNSNLQNRLLKTWRDAQTNLEEQGVNILFLTLGMLEWYESENSNEPIRSPVIFIPVLIERKANRFLINYEGTDIGGNLSLAAKLSNEFDIKLPDISETDDFNIRAYFDEIKEAISKNTRWQIDDKSIVLGFFSYSKYLMFKDLEGDQWPDTQKPWMHKTLLSLLGDGFDSDISIISEEENIDKHRPVKDINEVCSADSSQVLAILEAKTGNSMVIEGPPGTGKSQTITNLIAEAIGEGKKVLFVAEKRAALEVVLRNLGKVNLQDSCLELHSNKTNKKDFYLRLESTVKLNKQKLPDLQDKLERLSKIRGELNKYCESLHTPITSRDITPFHAIGFLLKLNEQSEFTSRIDFSIMKKMDFSIMKGWTQNDFLKHKDLVFRIQEKVNDDGLPSNNPFFGSQIRIFMPDDFVKLHALCSSAINTIQQLKNNSKTLAERLGIYLPQNISETEVLCYGAKIVASSPPHNGVAVIIFDWKKNEELMRFCILSGRRYFEIHLSLDSILKPEAWGSSIENDRDIFIKYSNKWYRIFISNYWKSRKTLKSLCINKLPKTLSERLAIYDAIIEEKLKLEDIKNNSVLCHKMFGIQWQDEKSDWNMLETILNWIIETQKQVAEGKIPKGILNFLEGQNDTTGLLDEANTILNDIKDSRDKYLNVVDFLKIENELKDYQSQSIEHLKNCLNLWINKTQQIHNLIAFNHLYDEAKTQGIEQVALMATNWEKTKELLAKLFEWTWYTGILREAYENSPVLAKFDKKSHEMNINIFCELDEIMLAYNQVKISLQHWENVPRYKAHGNLGTLQREFAKKSRHLPIRKIMEITGDAIQSIKPVFMMSPISVAMYLPPNGPKFDLVIFDEASQIKPEDSFCSIIRASQAIVVGDSRQMPPSSFFDKLVQIEEDEDYEEETNLTRDIESILSLMNSKIPEGCHQRCYLRWHYRSKHDSLISPSNRMFYNNRLVVFPTAYRKHDEMGLKFNHLPNTIYERGKERSRTNPEEARLIVEQVKNHIRNYPNLSLGIAAFSLAQQEAILNYLELARSQEPGFIEFDKRHPNEPLFVKNLETVQGDERDVIFISIGYGRDETGFPSMSFGPLNNEGGERRLNVLITRARVKCEIFSNITSDDIRLSDSSKEGIRALKDYLYFAQTGNFERPKASGNAPMSPFEEMVIEKLTNKGYKVIPQVGSDGFFIDIGICDSENPEKFILGIECDGAKYHSARSARDRDKLRQEALEARGWLIHRIWSTDWWRNQDHEFRRLIEAIEHARLCCETPIPKPKNNISFVSKTIELPLLPEEPISLSKPYKFAKLNISLGNTQLRDIPAIKMANWVYEIAKIESPVHFDEIVRRIRENAGFERTGDAIREAVRRGVNYAAKEKEISFEKDFVWKLPKHTPEIRNRSTFPSYLRKIEYIHPDEIKIAIVKIVEKSFGIKRDDTITAVLKLFGFDRTTDELYGYVNEHITELLRTQKLNFEGEQLKTKD